MKTNAVTLNTVDAVAESSAAAESRPAFDPDSTGIINTVVDPGVDPDPAVRAESTKGDELDKSTDSEKAEEKVATDEDEFTTRFDKHPRFQELMQERNEARRMAEEARRVAEEVRIEKARLEAERELMKKAESPPYKDLTSMTDEEIEEWARSDPKGYAANMYLQIRHEVMNDLRGEISKQEQARDMKVREQRIKSTYDKYEAEHPDFAPMWESGEIMRFIENNPGHNPISAHMAIVRDRDKSLVDSRIKAAVDEAVAKAIKETEERVNKNWQAKRAASVLGGGPASQPIAAGADAELSNTKERGGTIAVLASRLSRLRQGV